MIGLASTAWLVRKENMNTEKLAKLETMKLSTGSHKSIDDGACIMEMVSYMADEPWSAHPPCACPILTTYAIRLNDRFNDEHRQSMKEFIPLLIGTRETDQIKIARKRLIRWRNVTATYPLILELLKLNDLAAELRKFENTLESMALAVKFLRDNKQKIYAAEVNAYANVNAYAYAYSYVNAYINDAYADAWRKKIADVALETLRQAIAVTGKKN